MVVGVCEIDLITHESFSLKNKRKVIKKIIERTKNRFNVSVAEVDYHDLWQKSKIGICVVSNSSRIIESTLDKVINFIENLNIAEIVNSQKEIINFKDFY